MSGKQVKKLRRKLRLQEEKRKYFRNTETGQIRTDEVRRAYQWAKKNDI